MNQKTYYGTGNDAFVCGHCHARVQPLTNGSFRNHCPACLWSKHVDVYPGDRRAVCGGLMRPVGVDYSAKKGWIVVHHCTKCGHIGRNKTALNDLQSDDFGLICTLSGQPRIYS